MYVYYIDMYISTKTLTAFIKVPTNVRLSLDITTCWLYPFIAARLWLCCHYYGHWTRRKSLWWSQRSDRHCWSLGQSWNTWADFDQLPDRRCGVSILLLESLWYPIPSDFLPNYSTRRSQKSGHLNSFAYGLQNNIPPANQPLRYLMFLSTFWGLPVSKFYITDCNVIWRTHRELVIGCR